MSESDVLGLLEQLSESSVSTEAESFASALERYQEEAKSMQQTLKALYGEMAEQVRSARQSPVRIQATEEMIVELKEKMERLDDERRELNEQMKRMADMSLSKTSECDEMEELRRENRALKMQLDVERAENRRLKQGFADVLKVVTKQCESLVSKVSNAMGPVIGRVKALVDRAPNQELISFNTSDSAPLLARACDRLVTSVLQSFKREEKCRPALELSSDKGEFSRYISEVCAIQEKGVHALNEELSTTKEQLEEAQQQLEDRTISKDVAAIVKRILAALDNVSQQMASEHNALISKLS